MSQPPDAPVLSGPNIADPAPVVPESNIYREKLPDGCPPSDAIHLTAQVVQRLAASAEATDENFKSHACLGRKRPSWCDECCHSSCSVFLLDANITELTKLPSMKKMKHIILLNVDEASGVAKIKQHSGHIDLWMYAAFQPLTAIAEIRTL